MRTALIYADSKNSAPFRYRCDNITEALKSSKSWHAVCVVGDYEKAQKILKTSSLLIVERQTDKNGNAKKLIKIAKKQGIKVAYDVDDLVFHPKYTFLLTRATGSRNPLYWFSYSFLNYILAKKCDKYICTNNFLAKKLQNTFHRPVEVIPNFLNKTQVDLSKEILATKKPNQEFSIGYFSGSPTHAKDFALIESDITRFINTHDQAKLLIVGELPITKSMQQLVDSGKIILRKKVDYKSLQKIMSSVDINLAPLVINDFTNCKSELKFFEPAIVEVLTIASPSFAFKISIKHGETGYICEPNMWYKHLDFLYNHKEKIQKISKNACRYCLENYYGKKIQTKIEEVYDELAK